MDTLVAAALEEDRQPTPAPCGAPPCGEPTVLIKPTHGLAALGLGDLWPYRELLLFLAWRDIKVRYKQTALGVAWVVLQPLIAVLILNLIFGLLLKVPSGNVPYAVFACAALVPWNYFAGALGKSSTSLVLSANLITKVYFPRLIIPLSAVVSGLPDLGVSFVVLIGLMAYYRILPTAAVLWLPVLVLLATLTALAFGLWLSALNVRYRDVNYLVPFLVQMWMYATPVIYSTDLIPPRYRFLLGLNPMTSVVEGFRWALLGPDYAPPYLSIGVVGLSLAVLLTVLVTGIIYFRTTERTFADVV
ncbi:MAG: ABC transporter permease [Chloroflexi bacterium]|nr:ABC transporter permease [Chloroflexota bacterium]